jgi:hypothetical protein
METLVAHGIKVTQMEGLDRWKVTWDNLYGKQHRWFTTFADVSRFIEGELL